MEERRKYIRVNESSHVGYQVMDASQIGDYMTADISQGGIRFYVSEFVPKGTVLKVRLTLKNIFFSFEALARVAWVREEPHKDRYEIGVEFLNLSTDDSIMLVGYIQKVLGLEGIFGDTPEKP
jgi:c-di-GMP-binding flagellar brake protein YcgR